MPQKQYYKFSDMSVENYYKMFGEISQKKSNIDFCDYFINFIVENYTMQGIPIKPFEGKIGNMNVKQWILGCDKPGMHHKPNYEEKDYLDIHRRIFKTWNKTSNDEYMKNHLMMEIMMFLSHTGNPCAYQQGMENVISYHKVINEDILERIKKLHQNGDWREALLLNEKEYEKEDCRNKGKRTYYEINKKKFLEMCIPTDEELRNRSKDRDSEDFNWREFILCKKFENFLTLTRVEYPDGKVHLSFHSYHQEFRILTEKVERHDYRILDFTYNPDGTITTSDNIVFNKQYIEAINFDLDDIEPSNIDTRYEFHGLDNRNWKNKLPYATDTNTFTFLRLKDQQYEFDNWILHDCRFSTDIIEATLYPLISKHMVAEAYGLDNNNFDYLDYWTKLFVDYFYTLKKYAFNMHFCWLVKDPKLMAIYNLSSGYTQRQKISFFESKRIFKHLYCLIQNSGHKLSEVKNMDDLKKFLFEEEFLNYIPVYIVEEKDYFVLTADLDVVSLNKIINKTGVAPVSASKDVIRNINRRDGAIITRDKSDTIKTKKDFEKYLKDSDFVVTRDRKMYLAKKIIDKELREIPVDRLNQSRNLGNYFTAIECIEKFCAAFISDRELGFDDNVIYSFLKPIPESVAQNTDHFSMEKIFNDNENGRNFIKTLNVDSIVNNLKEHGFFMKMKPEQIYHYVNNKEFKGTLRVKKLSVEELNNIQNYEDLFVYREKEIMKSIRNILVNGSINYNLDIVKQEGIDFKYSRRWMVPIYNNKLDIEEVLVYEMIYDEVKDRDDAVRNDNDTLSTLVDAMKMAFELNVPFNTRISTKAKLTEFHDNLSYTMNLLKQEKENDFTQYQITLPYMPIAAIVTHYYEGYTVLDDNMKIANEGNQQRNCILSYKDRAASGTLMLLSYQDPIEGRTSIELRAEHGGKMTPEGFFRYNIIQNKLKANRNPRKELEEQLQKQLSVVSVMTEGFNTALLDICIANYFRNKGIKCDLNGHLIDPDNNLYGHMDYTGENILKCSLDAFKKEVKTLTSMGDENKKSNGETKGDIILKDFMKTFGIKNLGELKSNPDKALQAYGKNVLKQPIGNMDPKVIEDLQKRIEEAALEAV